MEQTEKCSSEIAKKLRNIVRIVIYMTKKSISKSKLMLDLHLLFKRGKLASKAISHNYYYSALTCRSNDPNLSFVCPRAYEFSCSNTPARRRTKKQKNQEEEVRLVQKVMDILNRYDVVEAPPVRVADSLFETKEAEVKVEAENYHQVDRDAEDFINKFYKELKSQRRIAESPLRYHL